MIGAKPAAGDSESRRRASPHQVHCDMRVIVDVLIIQAPDWLQTLVFCFFVHLESRCSISSLGFPLLVMINQYSAHVLLIGIAPIMMDSNEVKIVVSSDLGFIKFAIAARLLNCQWLWQPRNSMFWYDRHQLRDRPWANQSKEDSHIIVTKTTPS
jgi:hypothetical protein